MIILNILKKIRIDIYFIITIILFISLIFINKINIKINNIYNIPIKPNDNFLFLGDSITEFYQLNEFYDNIPVVNSGVAGNQTDDILKNIDNRVTIYNPTKIFILIGTNDIETKDEKEIVEKIMKIVKKIREKRPTCDIYIESILPINNSDDIKIKKEVVGNRSNTKIKNTNNLLKKACKENNITYINIYDEFVEDNQLSLKYTNDGLHLSNLGYLHLTEILLPYLS